LIESASSRVVHHQRFRIYFEDTDAGGIVYHANWLRFFERARTDWLRAMAISQSELARATGLGFVVRSMQIDYLRPARLDDLVRTELEVTEVRRASLFLIQRALLEGTEDRLVDAQVRIAVIENGTGRARALPAGLADRLSAVPTISKELRNDAT
jgi:acyl-CoA thioester hydrolase